ncbi:type II toxin-antitoxin system MqsA family antitoxin [Cupriavidus oxalaticus]
MWHSARPPLALVKLLKLLDRHPELREEVRAASLPRLRGNRNRSTAARGR